MTVAETFETAPAGHLPAETDVVVIGAGFSGLAMAHALLRAGRTDFVVLERAQDVGGTWRDNTYPGCGCDVPSHLYSLSFAPNPEWSTTFSPQPEILRYLQDTARREGITEHIAFGADVERASWNAAEGRWVIETARGTVRARALVSGAGPLVEPSIPDVPGLAEFPGTVFHSATWNHDHVLDGERVAVIGTGASAIQFVPKIRKQVAQMFVFQRTAPWIMPRNERPLTRVERAVYRRFPALQQAMRTGIFWARESFVIPMLRMPLNPIIRKIALKHLERQVPDPELRAKLTPDYAPGCKRLLPSNTYLPALTQPNVELIPEGLVEVRGSKVVGSDGTEREVDTIIFGTGFQVTDPPIAERVFDGAGRALADHWAQTGVQGHRATTTVGFPNLFVLLGPNSGAGHMSAVYYAEAQVGYIMQALQHPIIEPRAEEQAKWTAAVQARSKGTVWTAGGCSSWYLDQHGRNTTIWPDFAYRYARELKTFRPEEHIITPLPSPVGAPEQVAA